MGKLLHIVKGSPERVRVSPPFRADFDAAAVRSPSPATVHLKVTREPSQSLVFEDKIAASLQPSDRLPTFLRMTSGDTRMARELAAAWVTPSSPAVQSVLEGAKKRAQPDAFSSGAPDGLSFPRVSAICDELRTRGVRYERDPSADSEVTPAKVTRRPNDVLTSGQGTAVEASLAVASLLEAAGLQAILVNVPGHMFVGWMPTRADQASPEAMATTVASRLGHAYFLETTVLGTAPPTPPFSWVTPSSWSARRAARSTPPARRFSFCPTYDGPASSRARRTADGPEDVHVSPGGALPGAPREGLRARARRLWRQHGRKLWWLHSVYALGLGVSVVTFAQKGFDHARWLAVTLGATWLLVVLFFRAFERPRGASAGKPVKLRFYVITYVLKNLYQGMLFFLLPSTGRPRPSAPRTSGSSSSSPRSPCCRRWTSSSIGS